jgi:hypothetical protein
MIANKLDLENDNEAKVLDYLKLCSMSSAYDTKANNQFLTKNYF